MKGKTIKLRIPVGEAPGLNDLSDCYDIHDMTLSMVTELDVVTMLVMEEDFIKEITIPVSVGRRKASLSYYMLECAKNAGWEIKEINGKSVYEFEIEKCDVKRPFLVLPFRHFNMSDHSA
jgi:hypothetical protein